MTSSDHRIFSIISVLQISIDRRADRQKGLGRPLDRFAFDVQVQRRLSPVDVQVQRRIELQTSIGGHEAAVLEVAAVEDGLVVFGEVDEEGDRAVERGQEVRQVGHRFQPAWPRHVLFTYLEKNEIALQRLFKQTNK